MKTRRFLPLLFLLLSACATSFQAPQLPRIDAAVETAIAEKRIPGGVLWLERDGRVYQRAYGNRALVPEVEQMTVDTIFDAASITKPVATASSIAVLIERGKIAPGLFCGASLIAPPGVVPGRNPEVCVRRWRTVTSASAYSGR